MPGAVPIPPFSIEPSPWLFPSCTKPICKALCSQMHQILASSYHHFAFWSLTSLPPSSPFPVAE